VRILCITDEYPWPATRGYRIRAANAVRGLAQAGSVDLFCVVSERPDLGREPPGPSLVSRVHVEHRAPFGPSPARMWRWVRTGWPRPVAWLDWKSAEVALREWARPPYDLVWFYACGTWLALDGVVEGQTIVDLNDLEDLKLVTLMNVADLDKREGVVMRSSRQRLRRALGAVLDRQDVKRWERVQRRAALAVDAVVVCRELDRERLTGRRVVVVPNSYDLPVDAATPHPPPEPVFTMVSLLTYPPNADAARYFAHQIWPLVHDALPTARLQLVGRHDGSVDELADVPGIEVRGEVADLEEVFARTTAVVVPLRAGGGTRIKILEAFARRVPVVATTLGAEGLPVADGVSLLIGDTPADFAQACVRLAQDPELARSLADAGHGLWTSRYRGEDASEIVRELVIEVAQIRE
jgi:glycosyltransferase involved in cell wall biosynthesis